MPSELAYRLAVVTLLTAIAWTLMLTLLAYRLAVVTLLTVIAWTLMLTCGRLARAAPIPVEWRDIPIQGAGDGAVSLD